MIFTGKYGNMNFRIKITYCAIRLLVILSVNPGEVYVGIHE